MAPRASTGEGQRIAQDGLTTAAFGQAWITSGREGVWIAVEDHLAHNRLIDEASVINLMDGDEFLTYRQWADLEFGHTAAMPNYSGKVNV